MMQHDSCDDEFIRRYTSSQGRLRGLVLGLSPTRADADDILPGGKSGALAQA